MPYLTSTYGVRLRFLSYYFRGWMRGEFVSLRTVNIVYKLWMLKLCSAERTCG